MDEAAAGPAYAGARALQSPQAAANALSHASLVSVHRSTIASILAMAAQLLLSACGAAAGGLACALGATLLGKRKRAPAVVAVVTDPQPADKAAAASEGERPPLA